MNRLRYWLIGLLAGRALVVVNARLDCVPVEVTLDCDAVFIRCAFHGDRNGPRPPLLTVNDRDAHRAKIEAVQRSMR